MDFEFWCDFENNLISEFFLTILIIFSIKVSNVTFDSFNSRYAMCIKNITTDEALFDIFNLLGIVKDGIR